MATLVLGAVGSAIGGGFGGKVPVYPGYVIGAVASLLLHNNKGIISATYGRDSTSCGLIRCYSDSS